MFPYDDARRAAKSIREAQLNQLAAAARGVLDRMEPRPTTIVISGQGEFLARQLATRIGHHDNLCSLADELGPEVSRCACAHALATLAREGAAR